MLLSGIITLRPMTEFLSVKHENRFNLSKFVQMKL